MGGHTLAEAKVDLLELIKAEGPFDACLGFSQGAALLAAVIMDHQRQHQFGPNLFQLAIFICAGAPVLVTKSLQEPQNSVDLPPIQSMAPLTEPWLGPFVPGHSPQEDESWNIFVPDSVREAGMMIRIPTAHIYGAKDSRVKESLRLRDMCDPRKRVELDHGRGHEVPRASHLVQQMKDIIRKAIDKSLTAH